MTPNHMLIASKGVLVPPLYNVKFYTRFSDYPTDNTVIYDYVSNSTYPTTTTLTKEPSGPNGAIVANFAGTTSFNIELPEPLGTSDFTIEGWASLPGATSSTVYMIQCNGTNSPTSGTINLGIGVNATKLYTPTGFGVNNNTNLTMTAAGGWYHYCMMRRSNRLYRFVNGVVDPTVVTITKSLTFTTWTIGSYTGGSTLRLFKGLHGDAAVTGHARYPVTGFTPMFQLFDVPPHG